MGERTQEMRTILNQDMGEVNAGNGGKILGSPEDALYAATYHQFCDKRLQNA